MSPALQGVMIKTEFLSGPELWRAIDDWTLHTQGRKQVAVAYVGRDTTRALRLSRGDCLHCAGSVANAKAGVVNPSELMRLRRKGVRLYADQYLHAKIYLSDSEAIIGSPNLSKTSRILDEAAIRTAGRSVLKQARAWFAARQAKEISKDELEAWSKVYRAPRGPFIRDAGVDLKTSREALWLIDFYTVDVSDDELRLVEATEREALKLKKRQSVMETLTSRANTMVARDLKQCDKVICGWHLGRGMQVSTLGTCIAINSDRTASARVPIAIEFPSSATVPYSKFRRFARAEGYNLGPSMRVRKVTNPVLMGRLMRAAARIGK